MTSKWISRVRVTGGMTHVAHNGYSALVYRGSGSTACCMLSMSYIERDQSTGKSVLRGHCSRCQSGRGLQRPVTMTAITQVIRCETAAKHVIYSLELSLPVHPLSSVCSNTVSHRPYDVRSPSRRQQPDYSPIYVNQASGRIYQLVTGLVNFRSAPMRCDIH